MRAAARLLAVLALAGATAAPAGAVPRERPAAPAAVPGELIVAFERGASAERRAAARRRAGVRVRRALRTPGAQLVAVEPGADVEAAARSLRAEDGVRSVAPNRVMRSRATTPDDPLFGSLWGLEKIRAPEAWDVETGDASVLVAVVDEGVQYRHPDLAPRMWTNPEEVANGADDDGNGFVDDVHGADTYDGDGDPVDVGGHGTHVAGTIAARGNDGWGMTGVAWDARVMAVRALGPDGGSDATVADAFQYAVDQGAKVVNASLGRAGDISPVQHQIIAQHPEVLFVFAAGNEGQDADKVGSAPCADPSPNVLCVAATEPDDKMATYSNYGATTVDLGAPGSDILSAAIESALMDEGFEDRDAAGWTATGTWTFGADEYGVYAIGAGAASLARTVEAGARECKLTYYWATTGGTATLKLGATTRTLASGGWYSETVPVTGSVAMTFAHSGTGALYLDDIAVTCPSEQGFGYMSGTSMATPHVAGVGALLFAHRAGLTGAQAAQAILAGATPVASLAGRTVSGGRLDARAALGGAVEALEAVTGAARDVTATAATVTGTAGGTGTYSFEYGTSTAYGSATAPAPVSGQGVAVSHALAGLEPGRTYHFRLVVRRGDEVRHGADRTFTTSSATPAQPVVPAPDPEPVIETPVAPVTPVTPPVPSGDAVAEMRRTARAACKRVRGRLRCTLTAAGARTVRAVVRDRNRRVAGVLSGRAGRPLSTRARRLRRGTYRLTITFTDAAGRRAVVTKSVRVR